MTQNTNPTQSIEALQPNFTDMPSHVSDRLTARFNYSYSMAGDFGRTVLEALAEVQPLGYGAEKIVYPMEGKDKVIALLTPPSAGNSRYDYSIEALKKRFYERKLLHLLLPECMPDIHMISSEPPMLVLDRVERPEIGPESRLAMHLKNELDEPPVERKLRELGVDIDSSPSNRMLDKEGHEVFVDNPNWEKIDMGMLEAAIGHLPQPERQRGMRYLSRLKQLIDLVPDDETNESVGDTELTEKAVLAGV